MIIRKGLGDFYKKSEIEFLGTEINYQFMTPSQLNNEIAKSIALYNKLYPPKNKFMRKVAMGVMIAGTAGVAGAAILASYGVGMGTALGTVFGAGSATAAAGGTIASIQTAASGVVGAGLLYGKVTGDTPKDLIKAADLIKSDNALDALEKVATEELKKKGVEIQEGDKKSQDALRERLKMEQNKLSDNLRKQAALKSQSLGLETPTKKELDLLSILAVATPFILMRLG